jgi:hypothetical protein
MMIVVVIILIILLVMLFSMTSKKVDPKNQIEPCRAIEPFSQVSDSTRESGMVDTEITLCLRIDEVSRISRLDEYSIGDTEQAAIAKSDRKTINGESIPLRSLPIEFTDASNAISLRNFVKFAPSSSCTKKGSDAGVLAGQDIGFMSVNASQRTFLKCPGVRARNSVLDYESFRRTLKDANYFQNDYSKYKKAYDEMCKQRPQPETIENMQVFKNYADIGFSDVQNNLLKSFQAERFGSGVVAAIGTGSATISLLALMGQGIKGLYSGATNWFSRNVLGRPLAVQPTEQGVQLSRLSNARTTGASAGEGMAAELEASVARLSTQLTAQGIETVAVATKGGIQVVVTEMEVAALEGGTAVAGAEAAATVAGAGAATAVAGAEAATILTTIALSTGAIALGALAIVALILLIGFIENRMKKNKDNQLWDSTLWIKTRGSPANYGGILRALGRYNDVSDDANIICRELMTMIDGQEAKFFVHGLRGLPRFGDMVDDDRVLSFNRFGVSDGYTVAGEKTTIGPKFLWNDDNLYPNTFTRFSYTRNMDVMTTDTNDNQPVISRNSGWPHDDIQATNKLFYRIKVSTLNGTKFSSSDTFVRIRDVCLPKDFADFVIEFDPTIYTTSEDTESISIKFKIMMDQLFLNGYTHTDDKNYKVIGLQLLINDDNRYQIAIATHKHGTDTKNLDNEQKAQIWRTKGSVSAVESFNKERKMLYWTPEINGNIFEEIASDDCIRPDQDCWTQTLKVDKYRTTFYAESITRADCDGFFLKNPYMSEYTPQTTGSYDPFVYDGSKCFYFADGRLHVIYSNTEKRTITINNGIQRVQIVKVVSYKDSNVYFVLDNNGIAYNVTSNDRKVMSYQAVQGKRFRTIFACKGCFFGLASGNAIEILWKNATTAIRVPSIPSEIGLLQEIYGTNDDYFAIATTISQNIVRINLTNGTHEKLNNEGACTTFRSIAAGQTKLAYTCNNQCTIIAPNAAPIIINPVPMLPLLAFDDIFMIGKDVKHGTLPSGVEMYVDNGVALNSTWHAVYDSILQEYNVRRTYTSKNYCVHITEDADNKVILRVANTSASVKPFDISSFISDLKLDTANVCLIEKNIQGKMYIIVSLLYKTTSNLFRDNMIFFQIDFGSTSAGSIIEDPDYAANKNHNLRHINQIEPLDQTGFVILADTTIHIISATTTVASQLPSHSFFEQIATHKSTIFGLDLNGTLHGFEDNGWNFLIEGTWQRVSSGDTMIGCIDTTKRPYVIKHEPSSKSVTVTAACSDVANFVATNIISRGDFFAFTSGSTSCLYDPTYNPGYRFIQAYNRISAQCDVETLLGEAVTMCSPLDSFSLIRTFSIRLDTVERPNTNPVRYDLYQTYAEIIDGKAVFRRMDSNVSNIKRTRSNYELNTSTIPATSVDASFYLGCILSLGADNVPTLWIWPWDTDVLTYDANFTGTTYPPLNAFERIENVLNFQVNGDLLCYVDKDKNAYTCRFVKNGSNVGFKKTRVSINNNTEFLQIRSLNRQPLDTIELIGVTTNGNIVSSGWTFTGSYTTSRAVKTGDSHVVFVGPDDAIYYYTSVVNVFDQKVRDEFAKSGIEFANITLNDGKFITKMTITDETMKLIDFDCIYSGVVLLFEKNENFVVLRASLENVNTASLDLYKSIVGINTISNVTKHHVIAYPTFATDAIRASLAYNSTEKNPFTFVPIVENDEVTKYITFKLSISEQKLIIRDTTEGPSEMHSFDLSDRNIIASNIVGVQGIAEPLTNGTHKCHFALLTQNGHVYTAMHETGNKTSYKFNSDHYIKKIYAGRDFFVFIDSTDVLRFRFIKPSDSTQSIANLANTRLGGAHFIDIPGIESSNEHFYIVGLKKNKMVIIGNPADALKKALQEGLPGGTSTFFGERFYETTVENLLYICAGTDYLFAVVNANGKAKLETYGNAKLGKILTIKDEQVSINAAVNDNYYAILDIAIDGDALGVLLMDLFDYKPVVVVWNKNEPNVDIKDRYIFFKNKDTKSMLIPNSLQTSLCKISNNANDFNVDADYPIGCAATGTEGFVSYTEPRTIKSRIVLPTHLIGHHTDHVIQVRQKQKKPKIPVLYHSGAPLTGRLKNVGIGTKCAVVNRGPDKEKWVYVMGFDECSNVQQMQNFVYNPSDKALSTRPRNGDNLRIRARSATKWEFVGTNEAIAIDTSDQWLYSTTTKQFVSVKFPKRCLGPQRKLLPIRPVTHMTQWEWVPYSDAGSVLRPGGAALSTNEFFESPYEDEDEPIQYVLIDESKASTGGGGGGGLGTSSVDNEGSSTFFIVAILVVLLMLGVLGFFWYRSRSL